MSVTQVKVLSSASSKHAVRAEIEVNGVMVTIAFHTDALREYGWEPYDQPNPAAYIPLGFKRLHQVEGGGGVLLVSNEAVRTSEPPG